MFVGWLRRRRRRRLVAQSFPATWVEILHENVRHFGTLSKSEQRRVRDDVHVLVAEKNWEGCGGLVMSDEIRVTIAAQIAILVLGFDQQYFDSVLSILVYPDVYLAPERHMAGDGVILEGDSAREGEAWYRGPVILSWSDVLAGGRGESRGHNLVFHEFAHQLDMLNGRVADGVPALPSVTETQRWTRMINKAFNGLSDSCAQGRATVFDCYGATSQAEFFAVATETFFEEPKKFRHHDAELYSMFELYYQQDPSSRRAAGS